MDKIRVPLVWVKRDRGLWRNGRGEGCWYIAQDSAALGGGYWLIVSSGVHYGPFPSWELVTQHAEDVRAD